jgi:hypothetical protein
LSKLLSKCSHVRGKAASWSRVLLNMLGCMHKLDVLKVCNNVWTDSS